MNEKLYLWKWSGEFFGYRNEDELRDYNGNHVGKFFENKVYGPDGRYLVEILSKNRLITKTSMKSRHKNLFAPTTQTVGIAKKTDKIRRMNKMGYEDFPGL